jgi:hypothetical protein
VCVEHSPFESSIPCVCGVVFVVRMLHAARGDSAAKTARKLSAAAWLDTARCCANKAIQLDRDKPTPLRAWLAASCADIAPEALQRTAGQLAQQTHFAPCHTAALIAPTNTAAAALNRP